MPTRMEKCEECVESVDTICDVRRSKIKKTRKFNANLQEMKREAPNESGHMLPYYLL